MNHSPEPWGLHDRGHESPTICREIDEHTCHEIAVLTGCQGMSREELLANGDRIVACVNACAGVSTETLIRVANRETNVVIGQLPTEEAQ